MPQHDKAASTRFFVLMPYCGKKVLRADTSSSLFATRLYFRGLSPAVGQSFSKSSLGITGLRPSYSVRYFKAKIKTKIGGLSQRYGIQFCHLSAAVSRGPIRSTYFDFDIAGRPI